MNKFVVEKVDFIHAVERSIAVSTPLTALPIPPQIFLYTLIHLYIHIYRFIVGLDFFSILLSMVYGFFYPLLLMKLR